MNRRAPKDAGSKIDQLLQIERRIVWFFVNIARWNGAFDRRPQKSIPQLEAPITVRAILHHPVFAALLEQQFAALTEQIIAYLVARLHGGGGGYEDRVADGIIRLLQGLMDALRDEVTLLEIRCLQAEGALSRPHFPRILSKAYSPILRLTVAG